jgi:pimeloyl-ACP methyl ester carboxylesterase
VIGSYNIDRIEDVFVTVGGVRLHYQRAGAGPPLLLLHGLVGSAKNWRQNIAYLAQQASVYALDLPNMGESERVTGLDASLEAIADRVAAFIDAIGLDVVDLSGHSHGGAVAMMLAARHPDRIRRLILFAPANPYCNLGHQLIGFYQTRFGIWLARQVPWLPRAVKLTALSRMYGDPSRVEKEALDGYTAGLRIPGTMDHVLNIVSGWHDGMTSLHSALGNLAEKPTLLIWGDRDRAVGLASARELQHILTRSRLMVLPGVGHIPFEEMPDVCNRAMLDWLSSPLPSAKAVPNVGSVQTSRPATAA